MTKIGKNLNLGIPILKIRYFAHLYMVADNWNISAKKYKFFRNYREGLVNSIYLALN